MTTDSFAFSVSDHAMYLAGYLDAVGRLLTTDVELCALTARYIRSVGEAEAILGMPIRNREPIESWPKEFGALVDGYLGMNQRTRIGFYLVDYVCWFEEFTNDASCFKVDCKLLGAPTISQVVYLLELANSEWVLIIVERSRKETQNAA
jgi:hypothetical protein